MHFSINGGTSWTQAAALPLGNTCCDPTVDWSFDGSFAYAAALAECGAVCDITLPNTAAGTADVDGGVCVTRSPVVDASAFASAEVSLNYFHGQRDAGDDAGDFFVVELSLDGGVSALTAMRRRAMPRHALRRAWTSS